MGEPGTPCCLTSSHPRLCALCLVVYSNNIMLPHPIASPSLCLVVYSDNLGAGGPRGGGRDAHLSGAFRPVVLAHPRPGAPFGPPGAILLLTAPPPLTASHWASPSPWAAPSPTHPSPWAAPSPTSLSASSASSGCANPKRRRTLTRRGASAERPANSSRACVTGALQPPPRGPPHHRFTPPPGPLHHLNILLLLR